MCIIGQWTITETRTPRYGAGRSRLFRWYDRPSYTLPRPPRSSSTSRVYIKCPSFLPSPPLRPPPPSIKPLFPCPGVTLSPTFSSLTTLFKIWTAPKDTYYYITNNAFFSGLFIICYEWEIMTQNDYNISEKYILLGRIFWKVNFILYCMKRTMVRRR